MSKRNADIEELTEQVRDAEEILKGIKEEAKRLGLIGLIGNMDMALSYVSASRRSLDR
jgi:hypothetical protein